MGSLEVHCKGHCVSWLRLRRLQLDSTASLKLTGITPRLFASLCPRLVSLTSLDLSYCNLGNLSAELCAQLLLGANSSLRRLVLSGNKISNGGAEALAVALHTNTSLQVLDLSTNWIGTSGQHALGKALETNLSLTSLDLSYNQIRSVHALAAALGLGKSALRVLNLSKNQLGVQDGWELGEALRRNCSLVVLKLAGNQMRDLGARDLSNALGSNATLQVLDLGCNRIEEYGAMQLVRGAKRNVSLTWLELEGNALSYNEGFSSQLKVITTQNRARRGMLTVLAIRLHSPVLRQVPVELLRLTLSLLV